MSGLAWSIGDYVTVEVDTLRYWGHCRGYVVAVEPRRVRVRYYRHQAPYDDNTPIPIEMCTKLRWFWLDDVFKAKGGQL